MTKTVELRTLNGVRNDVSPERFDRDEHGRYSGKTDLAAGVNVDVDETGKLTRRLGTNLLSAGAAHSLFAAGDNAYVVVGATLNHVSQALALTPVAPVYGRVAYAEINGAVHWSDGRQGGILNAAANVPWGVAVPPVLTASSSTGALRPGRYLFAMTYVRSSGEESGAPKFGELTVGANQGIQFTDLPVSSDPLVANKRIYLTQCDGNVAYLAATLMNSQTVATISELPVLGMLLRTQFLGPLPPGQVVGYFAGRAVVASGRYLWYSLPHEYSLCDLRSGFVGFPAEVRTFAPVSDGVFIGSEDATYWLGGSDPTQWTQRVCAPYGTVLGTECVVPGVAVGDGSGDAIGWFSKKGLCLGFDGGQMQNVTGARYTPPVAREGASLFKNRGGTPQVVTTLFN